MHSHPHARLTQRGRLQLLIQNLEEGRSLSELAAENEISLRCAYSWLARYRAGVWPFWRIERPPHPAADARSAAAAARRGAPSPAAPPPTYWPFAADAILHFGRGTQPTAARALAQSGSQTTGKAVRMGAAGRPDPHRNQVGGPVPEGGSPHHRRSAAGRSTGVGYEKVHFAVDDDTRLS
jgi:hypothetical protein